MTDLNLNDLVSKLNLFDETPVERANALPEQRGGMDFTPPQPGRYRFRLQSNFKPEDFETFKSPSGAERIKVKLRLSLVGKSGRMWFPTITNSAYQYSDAWVTDMDYLLQALGAPLHNGATNREYLAAILKHGGAEFFATSRWSVNCSATRPQRDEAGKEVIGKLGCGRRYIETKETFTSKKGNIYHPIPKDEQGLWAERFRCKCGSVLRVFPSITAFEPVPTEEVPF